MRENAWHTGKDDEKKKKKKNTRAEKWKNGRQNRSTKVDAEEGSHGCRVSLQGGDQRWLCGWSLWGCQNHWRHMPLLAGVEDGFCPRH